MPKFGPFEAEKRLYLSGVGGLFALANGELRVIKVLEPHAGIWPNDRIQEEVDAFRLRAKIQKSLADKSKQWAPVHDVAAIRTPLKKPVNGRAAVPAEVESLEIEEPEAMSPPAGGAFCVMDRYERSAQSLIDGQVNILSGDLQHIITEVIHGLLAIRKSGRPHGNLKPANILLKNSAELTTATVHLSDPAADGSLTKGSAEKELKDLGEIIYHLVNLRPYDGGTIPRTKDWDKLGPEGENWRKLCNALLDAHAPPEDRDLEKALPKIATWIRKPKKSKAPMLAAASLSFLIIGGLVFYLVLRPIIWPPVQWDQERWNVLNLEYRAWFGDFSSDMYNKAVREKVRRPPYPDIGNLLDAAGDLNELDPAVIAQNKGIQWDLRLLNPTPRAMNPGAGPEATKKAVELIQAIEAAITAERWSTLGRLTEAAKRYEEKGWQKHAEEIREIIARAKPPELPPATMPLPERIKKVEEEREARKEPVYASLTQTVDAVNQVAAAELRYNDIQTRTLALTAGDAGNVRLLAGLKDFAEKLPKEEATGRLKTLDESFKKIQELLDRIAEATTGNPPVDFVALAGDPAAQAEPSIEAYAAFTQVLPGYRRIATDPRDVPVWNTRLSSIKGEMIDLIAKEVPPTEPKLAAINTQFAAATEAVQKSAAIRPIAKFKADIDTSVAEITASLGLLFDAANSHPAYMNEEKFAAFVTLQRSRYTDARQMPAAIAAAAKPVRDKWIAGQTALVQTVAARTLDQFRQTHIKDEAQFRYLDEFYADANTTFPDADPQRTALLAAFPRESPWGALATHVANDYRENFMAEFLGKAVLKPDNPPALDSSDYKNQRTTFLTEYQRLCQEALALFGDQGTITERLDQLYLQANEPTAGNPTYRDLYAKWRDSKSTLLGDAAIAAVIKPISDRVTALLAVDDVKEYPALVAAAQSKTPEIALSAWRKLGSTSLTEEIPALEDETKAQTALAAHLTALTQARTLPAARAQTLNAELAAQRPIRWHRWADTLTDPEKIKIALDNLKTFNVSLTPQADSPMLYYQALFALQSEFAKSQKESDLKAPAQQFVDTVAALPDAVSKNADVADLLKRITKSLTAKEEETSAGAGPQLADWDVDKTREAEGLRIFRSKDRKYTLEFVKLQVTEGDSQKTIFLATTEMSLGLFIDTMNNSNRLDDVDNDKKTGSAAQHWFKIQASAGNDVYLPNGPRGWRLVQGKFTLNGDWLDYAGSTMTDQPYYPAIGAPKQPLVGHPVQLISPWSAIFTARLLGCRLPTTEEWKAAYQKFEVPSDGKQLPKDIWNLRGENPKVISWGSQQAHALVMAGKGLPYPDAGAHLPTDLVFKNVTGKDAKPWMSDALAKLAPERITSSPAPYQNNTLWFLEVDKESPTLPEPLVMHHLVGNVAEFVFDGEYGPADGKLSTVAAVVKDNKPSIAVIDALIADKRNTDKIGAIGGSSFSAPNINFTERSNINVSLPKASTGSSDLGFRLAFTAPIDSISDVLATVFKGGKPIPGPRVKKN